MLDELFYDSAHLGWMVSPWTPDGYDPDQDAIIEEHQERLLDKRNVYECESVQRDDAFHVAKIGGVIASEA